MWTTDALALLIHKIQARYVSSVNGQTGDVTVSGAVDSVNGQTGAVTLGAADVGALPDSYTPPVQSVNGQTGAVTVPVPTKTSELNNDSGFITSADIPTDVSDFVNDAGYVDAAGAAAAAPVQSVNGQTGAVTVSGGAVDSVDGGTGDVDTWAQRFLGDNPISSTANDTVANWRSLGSGWAWYSQLALTDQPGQWGFLFSAINNGNDVVQVFVVTQNGAVYTRNGYIGYGGAGWVGTWSKLATASELAAKSNALTVMEKSVTRNFSGSTSYTVTKDVTEAGYTPLGIVGFSSSADYKYFASCYLNGTTATALVRNTSSSAANNVTITFYVLYAAA